LTLYVKLPRQGYSEPGQLKDLYDRLLERLRGLPGVQATGTTSQIPIYTGGSHQIAIEGATAPTPGGAIYQYVVSPDYFVAVGIPLVKGRRFDQRDRESAESVVLVNEDLARRFFPDQDPLGKLIRIGASESQSAWLTIVGVVGDTKYNLYGNLG